MSQGSQGPGAGPWGAQIPAPPTVPPPPRLPPAGPYPAPGEAPVTRRQTWAILVGAVAVLLVGILIGYIVFQPRGLRLPPTIANVPRLAGTHWNDVAGGMIDAAGTKGRTNVAGVYGRPGSPAFAFLATDEAAPATSNAPTIGLLAQYLENAMDVTLNVDLTQPTTLRRGGVTYECYPIGLTSQTGFACAWNDAGTAGYVLALAPTRLLPSTPFHDAAGLSAEVRTAVIR